MTKSYYQKRRPDGTLREATQNVRDILICEIDGCQTKTYRLNSSKCRAHRGICGFSGCGDVSWEKPENIVKDLHKNGKDFRYCVLHRGRLRGKREMGAPRGKARPVISFEDDAIEQTKLGVWAITPNGYVARYSQTKKGRSVTQLQHRYVMEEHIGRPLLSHENIHHRNGDRTDNRIENLELWSISQPSGQRVSEKISWMKEYLESYGYTVTKTDDDAYDFEQEHASVKYVLHYRHPDFTRETENTNEEHNG